MLTRVAVFVVAPRRLRTALARGTGYAPDHPLAGQDGDELPEGSNHPPTAAPTGGAAYRPPTIPIAISPRGPPAANGAQAAPEGRQQGDGAAAAAAAAGLPPASPPLPLPLSPVEVLQGQLLLGGGGGGSGGEGAAGGPRGQEGRSPFFRSSIDDVVEGADGVAAVSPVLAGGGDGEARRPLLQDDEGGEAGGAAAAAAAAALGEGQEAIAVPCVLSWENVSVRLPLPGGKERYILQVRLGRRLK